MKTRIVDTSKERKNLCEELVKMPPSCLVHFIRFKTQTNRDKISNTNGSTQMHFLESV